MIVTRLFAMAVVALVGCKPKDKEPPPAVARAPTAPPPIDARQPAKPEPAPALYPPGTMQVQLLEDLPTDVGKGVHVVLFKTTRDGMKVAVVSAHCAGTDVELIEEPDEAGNVIARAVMIEPRVIVTTSKAVAVADREIEHGQTYMLDLDRCLAGTL